MSTFMKNKNIVVMGVANKWSIAWGISKVLLDQGANLIFTYQGEKIKQSIEKLLEEENITNGIFVSCDVSADEEIENAFAEIKKHYDVIHGVVHCIAYSKKEELRGNYYDTSREGYHLAQDISAYSLVKVTQCAAPLMSEGGGIVTLSYLGGERVVKNYNVMGVAKAALEMSVRYLAHDLGEKGIRVNAISAGPVKTLAAKGVGNFGELMRIFEEKAPMKRMVTLEEIGNTAFFFLSDLSTGVTGEVIHVDCGYSILGY